MCVYRVWHNRRENYTSERKALQDSYTGRFRFEFVLFDGNFARAEIDVISWQAEQHRRAH